MHFSAEPYCGALPIKFGMAPEDVAMELGKPTRVTTNWLGELDQSWGSVSVRYSKEQGVAVEIALLPSTKLLFGDIDLFRCDNPIGILMQHDSIPYESLGFIVFMELGMTITGFHDRDDAQRAITMFQRGRWDAQKPRMKPYVGA